MTSGDPFQTCKNGKWRHWSDSPAMKISILPRSLAFLCTALMLASCQRSETTATAEAPKSSSDSLPLEYAGDPVIKIETSMGDVRAELFKEKAPKTVTNFLQYVDTKFFDNTIFHRVIADFMIQGGGFENSNGNFVEKETKPPVPNESHNGLKNRRGTLAMARTNDPHSATAQFFINVKDNTSLDLGTAQGAGYAVFGKVLSGMDVVDQIRKVPTGRSPLTSRLPTGQLAAEPQGDVPLKAVIIKSITVEPAAK